MSAWLFCTGENGEGVWGCCGRRAQGKRGLSGTTVRGIWGDLEDRMIQHPGIRWHRADCVNNLGLRLHTWLPQPSTLWRCLFAHVKKCQAPVTLTKTQERMCWKQQIQHSSKLYRVRNNSFKRSANSEDSSAVLIFFMHHLWVGW